MLTNTRAMTVTWDLESQDWRVTMFDNVLHVTMFDNVLHVSMFDNVLHVTIFNNIYMRQCSTMFYM